jgi:hypothetical protein
MIIWKKKTHTKKQLKTCYFEPGFPLFVILMDEGETVSLVPNLSDTSQQISAQQNEPQKVHWYMS